MLEVSTQKLFILGRQIHETVDIALTYMVRT